VPAVLIEGGFLTEQGQCKLIAQKDWRAKLARAISVGIESYRSLGIKKQPPLLVADYRKQIKSAPNEFVVQEAELKEADTSIMELVGKSKFLPPQQPSNPRASLESAPIVP
jgi:N-acetylmuramoyl-L-alanine amidase